MADFPAAAVDRLGDYNGARYDAQTNPFGFAIGGHRQNFPQSLNDTASVAAYVAATAQEVKDNAQAVVNALADAQAARDAARDWATKPEDQAIVGGLFSALHYARKSAASAAAAATFDPALFIRRDGTQVMTNLLRLTAMTSGRNGGVNLPQGTAPTNPANGDLWSLATGLWGTFGGVTRQVYDTASLPPPTNAEIDAGTNQLRKAWTVADVWRAALAALAPALAERFTKTESDARYPRLDGANAGPLGGFRNKLINPNGDINQRGYASGAAATAANQYAIDRWRVVVSGQNLSWTTAADGIRTFAAPAGGVEQIIEAANVEAGSYKLSWTGTATATVNGTAVTNGGTVTINGQANVTVRFSGGTFILPQLERGTIATVPERRAIGIELFLCQRYYELVRSYLIQGLYTETLVGMSVPLVAEKPVAPTVIAISQAGAANGGFGARQFGATGRNAIFVQATGPAGPGRGWNDVYAVIGELS